MIQDLKFLYMQENFCSYKSKVQKLSGLRLLNPTVLVSTVDENNDDEEEEDEEEFDYEYFDSDEDDL